MNMIAKGEAAQRTWRLQHLTDDAVYARGNVSCSIKATKGSTRTTVTSSDGAMQVQSRIVDFIVDVDQMTTIGEPLVGDHVLHDGNVYEVCHAIDSVRAWNWSGRDGQTYRIHTLQVTLDSAPTPAPLMTGFVIGDGTAQRSIVSRVTLTIDGPVSIQPGAFTLTHRSSGAVIATLFTSSAAEIVITFTGSGTHGNGALDDGYYELAIDGTKITRNGISMASTVIGAVAADRFFALSGDTDGDGIVGVAEFGQFRSTFGKSSTDAGFDARYDFDSDGTVGVADFGQFRARFGKPQLTF